MSDLGPAGFWSYAHADNEAENGAVLDLAARLKAEYSILTGEDLHLFIDRDSIAWGDQWRQRIEDALVQTTFFIPVITPRYFKRPECVRELLAFSGQAASLGVSELVLPILYAAVPAMSPESEVEPVALVARTQYVNWTSLRLADARSAEYRSAVSELAQRLVDIATAVGAKQVAQERQHVEPDSNSDEADLATLLGQINELLPDWYDAVLADKVVTAQHDATTDHHHQRMGKLRRSGSPPGALFAEVQRYVAEDLPLAERFDSLANVYLAKTMQLDPLVTAAVRLARQHPEVAPLLEELADSVREASNAIEASEISQRSPGYVSVRDWARRNAHSSRTMKEMLKAYDRAYDLAGQANEMVRGWQRDIDTLTPPLEEPAR